MKNIYFILALIIVFAQSCTIQRRQHLPGYHIEWNTDNAQREKKPEQVSDIAKQEVALVTDVIAPPLGQALQASISDAEVSSISDLDEEDAAVNGTKTARMNSEKRIKQRLTFPSIIHAPANMLFGSVKPDGATRTDGLSIAAMVCGILCYFIPYVGIILAILAIIFGGIGIRRTKSDPDLKGKGMAIAGLVLGIVGLLFVVLAAAILATLLMV